MTGYCRWEACFNLRTISRYTLCSPFIFFAVNLLAVAFFNFPFASPFFPPLPNLPFFFAANDLDNVSRHILSRHVAA